MIAAGDTHGATLSTRGTRPAVLVSRPAHGTVQLDENGSFIYTPDLDYNGSDSFTYKATDGRADSNVANVGISIKPVDDAPTARPVAYVTGGSTATGTFALDTVSTSGSIRPAAAQAPAPGADVAAVLAVPPTAAAGTTVPVSLTVCNNGPGTASGVLSGITLPPGLTVTGAGGGLVGPDRRSVLFQAATLAPGARVTYQITVTVARTTSGAQQVNGGVLSVRTADPNYANNSGRATITVTR